MAGHWNTKEPVPKEFGGSWAEEHCQCPQGWKKGKGREYHEIHETVAHGEAMRESRSITLLWTV